MRDKQLSSFWNSLNERGYNSLAAISQLYVEEHLHSNNCKEVVNSNNADGKTEEEKDDWKLNVQKAYAQQHLLVINPRSMSNVHSEA